MTSPPSTDAVTPSTGIQWCRNRLLVPGSSLSLTLPYAESELQDPILALRTVITEIASVPDEVSDPDVARRKLDWWRRGLEEQLPHPAITALLETGAYQALQLADFQRLITAVSFAIDPPRFERLEEWVSHCLALSAPSAMLEARLVENLSDSSVPRDKNTDQALSELAAASYQIRSVRDLVLDARHGRWWLPLELQAEFQLNQVAVASSDPGDGLKSLIAHCMSTILSQRQLALNKISGNQAWCHRHQMLSAALDHRLGQSIQRNPEKITKQRVLPTGILASVQLWRTARSLSRNQSV